MHKTIPEVSDATLKSRTQSPRGWKILTDKQKPYYCRLGNGVTPLIIMMLIK